MIISINRRDRRALTLLEAALVVAVFGTIILLLVLPQLAAIGPAKRTACVGRLRILALGERLWAHDSGNDELPAQVSTNAGGYRELVPQKGLAPYYAALSNEIGSPAVLVCPSDKHTPAAGFSTLTDANVSYFLNVDAKQTNEPVVLHGDRLRADPARKLLTLSATSSVDWASGGHGGVFGNVAFSDGSIHRIKSRSNLNEVFSSRDTAGHRLILP